MAIDGSDVRQLTPSPEKEEHPEFSPDGRTIVFVKDFERRAEVWTMNADGSGQRRLTPAAGGMSVRSCLCQSRRLPSQRLVTGLLFSAMTAPEEAKFRPKDTRFYNGLKYADAYMFQFGGVDHDEYAVGGLRLRNASEADPDRVAALEGFARTIIRYTGEFFDAHLKGKSGARAFLNNPPEANGVPSGMIRRTASKRAHPAPPSRDDFARLVRDRGVAAAAKVFEDAEAVDPELASMMTSPLPGPLFIEAFDAGIIEEALEICRYWARRIPLGARPVLFHGQDLSQDGTNGRGRPVL